jgi:hypothetical protein
VILMLSESGNSFAHVWRKVSHSIVVIVHVPGSSTRYQSQIIPAASDVVRETSRPKMRADMRPSTSSEFRRMANGLWVMALIQFRVHGSIFCLQSSVHDVVLKSC